MKVMQTVKREAVSATDLPPVIPTPGIVDPATVEMPIEEEHGLDLPPSSANEFVVGPEPEATDLFHVEKPDNSPLLYEVQYLRDKVETLREMLRGVYYRSKQEIEDDVQKQVTKLDTMSNPAFIEDYVNRNYTYTFWRNEPDVAYKNKLADSVLRVCKLRIPGYSNRLLESIVSNEPEAAYIMSSFIEE